MAPPTLSWDWIPREPPLPPVALYAEGEAAVRLARRLLADLPAGLSGVSAPDTLLLTGPADALPWVEGVRYLGRPPDAPALRLPTTRRPTIPEDLLQRALLKQHRATEIPLAVLEQRVLPLGSALPLQAPLLAAWLDRHR